MENEIAELYQAVGKTFVRIARSGDIVSFAAKAAKKGAGKSQSCNPSKSHSCTRPDGSNYCISLNRKCRTGASGTAKKAADFIEKKVQKSDKPKKSIAKPKPLTPAAIRKLEKEAGDFLADDKDSYTASKIAKIISENPSITFAEARAISTWIGTEKYAIDTPENFEYLTRYSIMNRAKYAPKSLPPDVLKKVEATNALAESAYRKMPALTEAYIRSVKSDKADFDPDRPLSRFSSLGSDVIQRYKDSIGKEIAENVHFATTHLQRLDWAADNGNVQFVVKPRYDGTSGAKYIDHYKNKMVEGEILYPPGTRFRVKSVTDGDPISDIPQKPKFIQTKVEAKLNDAAETKLAIAKTQAAMTAENLIGKDAATAKALWDQELDKAAAKKGTTKDEKDFYQELKSAPIEKVLDFGAKYKQYLDYELNEGSLDSPKPKPTVIELEEI